MHEISIAGCDDPNGPFLAGCRCGWTGEIRPAWPLALEDARWHLEEIEARLREEAEEIAS